jgi:hypothetical protein
MERTPYLFELYTQYRLFFSVTIFSLHPASPLRFQPLAPSSLSFPFSKLSLRETPYSLSLPLYSFGPHTTSAFFFNKGTNMNDVYVSQKIAFTVRGICYFLIFLIEINDWCLGHSLKYCYYGIIQLGHNCFMVEEMMMSR